MDKIKYIHHIHSAPDHDRAAHNPVDRSKAPYWKRAHHDWRFWVGLVLMLAAITIYVLSDDLAFLPHR